MDTLSTYRPRDLLLFSETVYWRLFELLNQTLWPLPLILPIVGAVMLGTLFRPRLWSQRGVPVVLAALWCLVTVAFLWYRYRPINWAIGYLMPLFLAQALLLAWLGLQPRRLRFARQPNWGTRLGHGLFAYAVLLHPFTGLLGGRSLGSAEVFGLAADPTAIATLGLIAAAGPVRTTWPWLVVPVIWCLFSGLTLAAMGTVEAWFVWLSLGVGIAAALWPKRLQGHRSATL